MIKRLFDIFVSLILLILLIPLALIISLLIKLTDGGVVLHWSKRVGINNKIFLMPKFRTMRLDTPQVATHLLNDSEKYITKVGKFLRKTSLDELPQVYSVLVGDMSYVGPRPALFNQDDLVAARTKYGVQVLAPGITGWAQINGRDNISIEQKALLDKFYLDNKTFIFDLKIMVKTLLLVLKRADISH